MGPRIDSRDRQALERLCRYITRPALSNERLALTEEGKVSWRLRKPYDDQTTHFRFDPVEFLEKLAALVPRPRNNLLRYHGVLAPASKWRSMVVPGGGHRGCEDRDDDMPAAMHGSFGALDTLGRGSSSESLRSMP